MTHYPRPPSPGLILKTALLRNGTSPEDAAQRLAMSCGTLQQILNGEHAILNSFALRVELEFGISADDLVQRQASWDLWVLREKLGNKTGCKTSEGAQ